MARWDDRDYPPGRRPSVKPEYFPLGSLKSRAAARVEAKRRELVDEDNALIVNFTGSYHPAREFTPPPANQPNNTTWYRMPDTSIVEVTRQSASTENESRCVIRIEQCWADGSVYNGDWLVNRPSDIPRLGGRKYQGTQGSLR